MSFSIMKLLLLTLVIFVPSSFILLANAQFYYDPYYYEHCGPSICGNSTIRYPFGICGPFQSYCEDNQSYVYLGDSSFRVLGDISNSTYSTKTLKIVQEYIGYDYDRYFDGITYRRRFFSVSLSPGYTEGTIVNCTREEQLQSDPRLNTSVTSVTTLNCGEYSSYCFFFPQTGLQKCTSYTIIFPENTSNSISADKILDQLQQTGFEITWSTNYDCNSCEATGGSCFSDSYVAHCICAHDGIHRFNCSDGILLHAIKPRVVSQKIMAEIFFTQCAFFSIVVVSCIVVRRKFCRQRIGNEQEQSILAFMDPLDSTRPSVENFLHYYSSQMPTRYSYSQIIAYTNNFADKIGKGGFGMVYKGKLPGGRLIAVKILDESKKNEHQFIAEVATVGRTYHINLVSLLGYCSQASKRALVYEYMVNGSLDSYIHGHGRHQNELDWKQLHSIAVGTARGIAYLHEECRNRILHFDIKPHNVLLDANFLAKVADFGLANISDRENSHVSVTNRGTLGYAAPEMCSENPGPVTDRSDVYSYGMLVMEMVGGRKNIDIDNKSSKLFYTEWAFKQVEKGDFGNLRKGSMSQEDQRIAKKLSLVGLWCIQYIASSRPPMSKVIQMLEGDVEIGTPPFPFRPVDISVQPSTSTCDESSSTHHALSTFGQSSSSHAWEVQMVSPTTTQTSTHAPSTSDGQSSSSKTLGVEIINPTTI